MKVKGKQVVEIRSMTRGEYDSRHYQSSITDCAERFGLSCQKYQESIAKYIEKNTYFCKDDDGSVYCSDAGQCEYCHKKQAKVNGKYIMLVRLKK